MAYNFTPLKIILLKLSESNIMIMKIKKLVFLTNNMEATAKHIVLFYKKRWQIELFFKWFKQHFENEILFGNVKKSSSDANLYSN